MIQAQGPTCKTEQTLALTPALPQADSPAYAALTTQFPIFMRAKRLRCHPGSRLRGRWTRTEYLFHGTPSGYEGSEPKLINRAQVLTYKLFIIYFQKDTNGE